MSRPTDEPPAPPAAAALLALATDDWASLLRHIRAALHDLEAGNPVIDRLRGESVARLAGGPARRELAHLLSVPGPLWAAVHARLRRGSPPPGLRPLLGTVDERPATADPRGTGPGGGLDAMREDVERLRQRGRELVAERDDARRRLAGAEARLAAAEERLAAIETALEQAAAHGQRLVAELEEAATERQKAVEREERRSAGRIEELEAELRAARRGEQELRRALRLLEERRRRDESRATAAADEEPVEPVTSRSPDAHPSSRRYAEALLVAGRHVLVDGYNVTRSHRPQLPLEGQRDWLVGQTAALAARRRLDVTVVFDAAQGVPRAVRQPRELTLRFSSAGLTADDELEFLVAARPQEVPSVVVTDDRELQGRVRALGAEILGTAPFVMLLG